MSQKQGLLGYCSVYYFLRIDLKSVIDSEFDYHGYQSIKFTEYPKSFIEHIVGFLNAKTSINKEQERIIIFTATK